MSLPELSLEVLLALAGGPAHGYAIGKDLEQRSDGRLGPTTGSLYQTLKRLTADGLVRQVAAPKSADNDDVRRKYFALTAAGRAAATAEISRLETLVGVARQRRLYRAGAR